MGPPRIRTRLRSVRALLLAGACIVLCGEAPSRSPLEMEVAPADYKLEFFPKARIPGQRPLVLALGGGAAKGIAHLGVLQRLQEEGLPVDAIAGTSMGALMGSMYASGYSGFSVQRMLESLDMGAMLLDRQVRAPGETLWEQERERAPFINLEFRPKEGLSFGHGSTSDLNLERVLQVLLSRGFIQSKGDFNALRIPFRAVSTNLETARVDAPDRGDLAMAVRASMCVPGIFRPVLLRGQQHVDGLVVQNLPVETARSLDPRAAVVAVEVGKELDHARQSSFFEVALRSLDASVEDRTEISRKACDLLLRPHTEGIPYLEFHRYVGKAVEEGRKVFDAQLDALESLLYGPQADLPIPCWRIEWKAPERLLPALQAIAEGCEPGRPATRRSCYRLLRRIQASGLVRRAWIQLLDDRILVAAEPWPTVREVRVLAPPEWRALAESVLSQAGLQPGASFNPIRLGQALDGLFATATIMARPLLDAQGTGFDADTGVLTLRLEEWIPGTVRIADGALSQGERRHLRAMLRPFEGRPLEARDFARQVILAERRLALEELQVETDPQRRDFGLLVTPVPDRRLAVDGTLAYETTWGLHGAVEARTHHLLDSDLGLQVQASTNRLWKSFSLGMSFPVAGAPFLSGEATARHLEYDFITAPGLLPKDVPYLAAALQGRSLRNRSIGAGITARVGMEDRGEVALEASRTFPDLLPSGPGISLPTTDQVQARFELDSFDRYLFPTKGTLVRVRLGEGRQDAPGGPGGQTNFQFAYARLRQIVPVWAWGGLEGDLEAGLGRHLPLPQWYRVGGPDFLSGSASSEFFTPNFALLRIGVPIRVFSAFGVNMQVIPRVDEGYIGSESWGRLRDGALVRGAGVGLRAELGRWFAEFAEGFWSSTGQSRQGWRLNVLLGTHPFDLWK